MESIVISSNNLVVKIDGAVLDQVFLYRQIGSFDTEAGGVLIGRELEASGNLIIEEITTPQKKDKRTRSRFERKDPAHISSFNEMFMISEETYGYFGEWHTHPEKIPHYSSTDRHHWEKIYKELPEKHHLIFLIAGIDAVGLWKLDQTISEQPINLCSINWGHLRSEEI